MIDQYRCGVFIGAFWHCPSGVSDHATDEMGVFGGDLAVGAVGNQDGALFIGDCALRVTLGEVGAAAVAASAYTYVHAHAAIFTFVGVLQTFHGQGAGGDIGGVGSDDGAAQGQLVAGAIQVANIDLCVDVLGSGAVAARFVVAGIGIPAARSTGADANADVAGFLFKAAGLGVGAGTKKDVVGVQIQRTGVNVTADKAGHVRVEGHGGGTEGTALPSGEVVVTLGTGFGHLGAAADVEAGACGGSCGDGGGRKCLRSGQLGLNKVGGRHRQHAFVIIPCTGADLSSIIGTLGITQGTACTIHLFTGLFHRLHGISRIHIRIANTDRHGGDFGCFGVVDLLGVLNVGDSQH